MLAMQLEETFRSGDEPDEWPTAREVARAMRAEGIEDAEIEFSPGTRAVCKPAYGFNGRLGIDETCEHYLRCVLRGLLHGPRRRLRGGKGWIFEADASQLKELGILPALAHDIAFIAKTEGSEDAPRIVVSLYQSKSALEYRRQVREVRRLRAELRQEQAARDPYEGPIPF